MFGLKEWKAYTIDTCSCFIHLQADRQTNGQTDRLIFCRCIDLRLVQSFNYLHASAFCAPSLRRLFQNEDDFLSTSGRFQWFKMNGFSCWKSFVCIKNPKNSLFGEKKTPIIGLHRSFVANDASFGTLPHRTLSYLVYRCLQQIFLFYQPSVELELWRRFHVFKKVRKTSRFDWDRQSLSFSEKLKPIDQVLLKFA